MFTKLPVSTALCTLAAQCMLSPISHAQTASLSLSNSAYIRVPTSPDFELQQFSLSVWFKPTGPGENGGGTLISKSGLPSGSGSFLCSWWLGWASPSGRLTGMVVHEYGVSGRTVTSNASVALGQEAHAVFTFDGTTLRLYINGVLDQQQPYGFTGVHYGSEDVMIGAFRSYTGPTFNRFQGNIDDVTIWGRALNATEIAALAGCEVMGSTPGLVAHYPFTCQQLTDTTGQGHSATAVGSVAFGPQAAALTAAPVICAPLTEHIVCPTGSTTFSAGAAGTGTLTYQWQWQPPPFGPGTPWQDLTNGSVAGLGTISGASTPEISLQEPMVATGITGALSLAMMRCTITNSCGNITTPEALLTVCPADFNCDGSFDFFDYLDFVSEFSAQSPTADFNADTVIDFFDYLDFVQAFSDGC